MPNKNHTQKFMYKKVQKKLVNIFQLQKSITIYLVHIFFNLYFFIQVDNINLIAIWHIVDFMTC